MSTRELAIGALISLLLSMAVYAVLAGLLGWVYHAGLSGDVDASGAGRLRYLTSFLTGLAWFLPAIGLWWLVVFLAGQHRIVAGRPAPAHRRVAAVDLWLLVAALFYLLWAYAVVKRLLPQAGHDCSRGGCIADCVGTSPLYFLGGPAIAAGLLLLGLRLRLRAMQGWA